ncbi:MAG: L,D-transpeptidase family protein [Solidesulfovibrio sp. DCME]|uniref:L,D-transpeptidase family protein n=1 Tax=Solidesulfovibrio sp. DCME TaxID=3447380 RepID=UPI003D11BE7C
MRRYPYPLPLLLVLVAGLCACQPAARRTAQADPAGQPAASARTGSPLAGAKQLLLVVTENFSANQARLRRFDRAPDGTWRPVGDDVAVTIGKNGLAWGRGLHGEPPAGGPVKVEGDGRSPAGVFTFSTIFAYQPENLWAPAKMPVHQVTRETVCVETIGSASYNRILDEKPQAAKDYDSPDRMLRPDGLYRYGLMVDHNAPDTKPGAGSCIFLHLWRRPGAPTVGCTAMNEPAMLVILSWIDAAKKPVIVQLPRPELNRLAPAWGAPELVGAVGPVVEQGGE